MPSDAASSESPPSTTTAPPRCCATGRSSPRRRRSASRGASTTRRFPHGAVDYCLRDGGLRHRRSRLRRVLREAAREVRSPAADLPRVRAARIRVAARRRLPQWLETKLRIPRALDGGLRGEYRGEVRLRRPPRVACRQRLLPVAVRGGRDPDPGRRRRVVHRDASASGAATGSTLTHELRFPHSLGLLYSAFTYYAGFKVNSAEYKVMGLAPYGEPRYRRSHPRAPDRPEGRRLVPHEHALLQLLPGPHA